MGSNKSLSLCLLFLSLHSMTAPGNAQQCYTMRNCQPGSEVDLSPFSPESCCLGDGFGYDSGSGCTICTVFGFTETNVVAEETGIQSSVGLGLIKSIIGLPIDAIRGTFNVVANPINATMPTDFTFAPAIAFVPGTPTTATYIVNSDGVALEGSETFELEIVVTDTIINLAEPGVEVIIQPKVTVTIADNDVVSISFSGNDYSQSEGSLKHQAAAVTRGLTDIGTNVTVRVKQFTVDQVVSMGIVIRDDFPSGYLTAPRAKETDFVNDDIIVTMEPGQLQIPITVSPREDLIYEETEVFILILELVDALDPDLVDFSVRGSALAVITDNDLISIGFEFPNYTFTEEDNEITYPIRLQKEDNGLAERDVAVDVSLVGTMSATEGEDFTVTMTTQTISFDMNEQTKDYFVTIRPDEIPEGVESFNLIVTAAAGSTLKPSQIPETTVFIIDNDVLAATVGFEETLVTTPEGAGSVELCVVVTDPAQDMTLSFDFNLVVNTEEGSAQATDYTELMDLEIGPFSDTNRRHCFMIPITNDDILENGESFTVGLNVTMDTTMVIIQPDLATVEITDDDEPTEGSATVTVVSYVTLLLSVLFVVQLLA